LMTIQTLPPIVILTDFGTKDSYVGTMKGVILRECPGVPIIDLTHEIAPQSVTQAAFVLWNSYKYFPQGTVFLVVVDPGVGSQRHAVALEAGPFRFVGPDNGIFTDTLFELGDYRAVAIDETQQSIAEGLTATFHGRDLFAPTAAHIACGMPLEQLGAPVEQLISLPAPRLDITTTAIQGEVVYIDHFGNVITSIGQWSWQGDGQLCLQPRRQKDAPPLTVKPDKATVTSGAHVYSSIARTYTNVAAGQSLALINSAGQLEIAVNQGNARAALGLAIGDPVTINLAP
ncbi:S-adenosyl-l-methionine hydroxide adenosyltransferase family protein, partial [Chloroflexota bacterium]